ncbi:MAG: SDR family oxidoreductase [Rhizobium sp.]|nr:MAG: SDR family oxidoreductase [Rhizobium sp.]
MRRKLEGRSAVVTGGLTGQGLAIAQALAAAGANVSIGSREAARWQGSAEPEHIADIRRRLSAHGGAVHIGPLDVRDTSVIEHFARSAEAVCGPADILVNSAGMTMEQPVCGHSEELWLKVIDTNLNGAFRMTRTYLPGMIERKWGRIINIGSTAASVGWKDNPAYCASKSGLLGLTRCVALEGAPHGVTCVMISPTWVETELMLNNVRELVEREGKGRTVEEAYADIARDNPQQRVIQVDEVAALAAFLCGDEARGITMENIQITGGALW